MLEGVSLRSLVLYAVIGAIAAVIRPVFITEDGAAGSGAFEGAA